MNRPLIIYHGNCADGFSAAWCFWRKYGNDADYVAGIYQQPPPDVTERNVYLVDFSYKRAVIEEMRAKAWNITILDHHKTAIDDLASVTGIQKIFDLERSGATITWDFLFPYEDRPLLLGHVEDRDLWKFKLAGTREIQANMFSHEYKFETWDKLMGADHVALMTMTANGAAIERKHHKDIAELVKVCKRRLIIGGHDVPVASLPYTLVSDAAHLMAIDEPFAACYWDTKEGRVFGLRSTDDGLDVSEIAKQYDGGGHAKAAGFTVPRSHELAIN